MPADEKPAIPEIKPAVSLSNCRPFSLVCAVLILLLVSALALGFLHYRKTLIAGHNREMALTARIAALTSQEQILAGKNTLLKNAVSRYMHRSVRQAVTPGELRKLKAKGLKDPVKEIPRNLMNHPEIIPYAGTFGGSMKFYNEGDIYLLSDRWVRAYFDDGHISGWMTLEYAVSDDGRISWKVVESGME